MSIQAIKIDKEYITLGQFLQIAELIQTGGMAKWFLEEYEVLVNHEPENRRGRKLRKGDEISIQDIGKFYITD